MKISAVILTKNEESNIEMCLEGLKWCSEVVVIDDFSEDKTVEIARKFTSKIYKRRLSNDFSEQRNFGLSKSTNEWALFIDADEIVNEKLRDEIIEKLKSPGNINGFYVTRRDYMWGREIKHGDSGSARFLRLARKEKGKWEGKVHEEFLVQGETRVLDSHILHYPHQNIGSFLKEINFYTDIRARELFKKGTKSGFLSIIFYTKAKFIQNYIVKLGVLDGMAGLVHAILMSLHSFLTRGKLWNLWQRK